MRMDLRFAIIAVAGLSLACCGGRHDGRLDRVAELAAESPLEALDSLAAIDPEALSEADRHYFDLLTIRARDKAYITHVSDSLVLDVIDYYAGHRSTPDRYPMAVYYGGRVYDDLGDYPTALKYFGEALDLLPPDTDDQALRCAVLSQYARMLNYLRLYDDAIPQVKSAIEIEAAQRDTINLIYDHQLLASIYERQGDYDMAEQALRAALDLGKGKPHQYTAESLSALASIKSQSGQIDSALRIIRGVPDEVEPSARCSALSNAAIIYYKAGELDTASMYSREILRDGDASSKAVAYQILLSPQMIDRFPADTLGKYIWDYRKLLERFFDGNQTVYALNQQNRYNYGMHERERAKAEHSNAILRYYIALALLALALIAILALYLKNKNKTALLALRKAIDNIEALESRLNSQQQDDESDFTANGDEAELREVLKDKLLRLSADGDKPASIPSAILNSDAYNKIQELIRSGLEIPDQDPLWGEIEDTVLRVSPNFKDNLRLLTMGKLTKWELQTAYLIKLGIKTSQMTKLLRRTNGAIISRRYILAQKVLNQKTSTTVIDSIIRLL